MNRNKPLVLAAVALLMAFLAVGCDRLWNDRPGKTNAAWHWVPGGPPYYDWMMSGASIIGQVKIERPTGPQLNAGFQMFGTRKMTKTHVHVATSAIGIPSNVNNWQYKVTHNPAKTQYTQPVAWQSAWDGANKLYVGMYAQFTGGGDCNTWKQIYTWTVTIPYKDVDLPYHIVTFFGQHPNGTYSYWKFKFSGVGPGYDVVDGQWYAGWCMEQTHYMNQNQNYLAVLWSTLEARLPIRLINAGWDNVNYLLNNKHPSATFWDIQAAIWYLLGNGGYPSDPEAQSMVAAALANGDGFKPSGGQLLAVALEPVCERQVVFIELDP